MKDKKIKELNMYFCPKCKSHEVKSQFSWRNAFGIFPRWKCKKCGYENMMFPIAVYNLKKSGKINSRKKRR